ncbi:hypothetical protein OS493_009723 [Desmophyllum pertusum]|uniref:Multidrug resistance-associated protein 4 n=1 Tax=Desmophyllum pertusum TaxID=174260 RepID=A0A9X0CN60_9CNID|nr:hypothetical protein OS493_009723 [Desmophyllum pertusum]
MEKTTENTPKDEKTKHPRDGVSVLSIMFFWWMNDVLRLGNKRPLTDEDLFPILEDYKSEVLVEKAENCWWDEINKRKLNNAKPRLWKIMVRLIPFKSAVVMIMLKVVTSIAFALLPLCLWLVLKTLNDGSNLDMKFAFMYVAFLGITSIVRGTSIQHFNNASELWGVKLKVALIGLVYKKVLSLNRYSLEATLSGNTINLVSNDAQKIEKFLQQLGYVLTAPVELVISLTILVYLIGWRALVGAAFFFALVAFQMLMGKKAAKLRGKAAKFTDQRLVVMNEIISGIRAVKMYAWEWNFRDIVCNLRRKEMAMIRLKGLIFSMLVVLYFTTLPITALISVTTLILTGQHLSSFEIFTVLLGIMTIRSTFCYSLGIAVQIVADGKVALDRIQTFLMENPSHFEVTKNQLSTTEQFKNEMGVQLTSYRERVDSVDVNSQTLTSNSTPITTSKCPSFELEEPLSTRSITSQTGVPSSNEPYLSISDASYSWNRDLLTEELSGITFNVCNGDMLAITGAVGSGKSSLLTAILGELPLSKGEISYHGKMAYVPQIPWVFSGTIRENILFGFPYNEAKFQHVVDICGLTKDLAVFNNGDLTEIGQRGVTLSGGQKARVGLARAVYSDADIYLLDDPLSAVDTKVGRALFESCILGHLSSRICLLVTHQLQYLKDVDCIAVMEKGSVIHLGKYTELKDKAVFSDILELSQHFEDVPERIRSVSLCEFNEKGNIMHRPRSATSVSHVKGQELPMELSKRLGMLHQLPEGDGPTERSGLDEFKDDGNMKNVTYRSSNSPVSLMNKTEGRDNEAFNDLEFSKLPGEESVDVIHVNNETTLQTAGSLVLHSTCDVPETDYRPVLDLKEEEESKRAGTVTWQLYWIILRKDCQFPS